MDAKPESKFTTRWWLWFDPRGKSVGSFGYMVNRLAGLGLTLYLFLHLFMLSKLIAGKEAFSEFIETAHTPVIVAGEFLVVFAVLLHGINGLRIASTSLGLGSGVQKVLLIIAGVIALAGGLFFAVKMFGGA